jgi:hypothetical protein
MVLSLELQDLDNVSAGARSVRQDDDLHSAAACRSRFEQLSAQALNVPFALVTRAFARHKKRRWP